MTDNRDKVAVNAAPHNGVSRAKIVRLNEMGGPEVLHLVQVEKQEPGPNEVRLRIRAIGLNRAEVLFRQGAYVQKPNVPSILGLEAAGEIEAVGSDVQGYVIGDRVCVLPAFA